MPKLNPFLEKSKKSNHSKEYTVDKTRTTVSVDCNAVSNPYGFSPAVKRALAELKKQEQTINRYPQGDELKQAIADFWSQYVPLDINRIVLSNAAIDSFYMINLLFNQPGATILGISPQYNDYIVSARLQGYNYRSVPLLKKDNYKFDVNRMLDGITSDLSLVYIDSPNNPTGQVISPIQIRLVLDKARSHDICVIVDESFGDYAAYTDSAAAFLSKYDNLIVIRSFSKGHGLSGIRAGYMLTSEYLKYTFDKISNPYVVSTPSRILAKAALSNLDFIDNCRVEFTKSKESVISNIGGKLHMAHTLTSCPLLLLWHNDPMINLAAEFAKHGVKVHSGADYENLAANSARLHLPHHSHMNELISVLEKLN